MRKKNKEGKTSSWVYKPGWRNATIPCTKKRTRHIILKLILIKYHSTHIILYCASTMWSFKVSNFIDLTSFTGRNIFFKNQNSSYLTIFMHIYVCLGQHLNGCLICFQTRYIYQVKVRLRTYPIRSCASFLSQIKRFPF